MLEPRCRQRPYFEQLLSAVSYLHSEDVAVAHCDIKLENVLLTSADQIKLSDFGLAHAFPRHCQRLTQARDAMSIGHECGV